MSAAVTLSVAEGTKCYAARDPKGMAVTLALAGFLLKPPTPLSLRYVWYTR